MAKYDTAALCSACSEPAHIVHGNYNFKESGLPNVVLCGIKLIKCDHCNNEDPIIPAMNDLFRTIALALVCKPYRLAGEEVRFLRKYLGLTGDKFSRLLHVDKSTLSKWENNDDPVGNQSDLAIRLVVMSQDDALRGKIAQTVREEFEKIQFSHERTQKGRHKKKYVPVRPRIDVNAKDFSYAYA